MPIRNMLARGLRWLADKADVKPAPVVEPARPRTVAELQAEYVALRCCGEDQPAIDAAREALREAAKAGA